MAALEDSAVVGRLLVADWVAFQAPPQARVDRQAMVVGRLQLQAALVASQVACLG